MLYKKYQLDTIFHQKPHSKLKIEAFPLPQKVMTDRKKIHIIVKSIHSSVLLESKRGEVGYRSAISKCRPIE